MKPQRFLTLLCALFLSFGLLAVPASAVTTFTGGTSQGTFAAKPAAPTITLSNVASSGKIKVSWNAVKNASSYKVYRATSKSGSYKLMKTTTGTSYTNTSAEAGKTYYYYVIALAKDGTKSAKSTIKSRTCDLPRPEITVSNVASSGKVKISWNAVEGATKYTLYIYDKDGTPIKSTTTTKTTLTHSSGKAGETYTYKVKAKCSLDAAASAYSAAKSRTCDLPRPVISVALNTSGKPVITWSAVPGAAKYTIYIYNKDGELLKTASTSGTKITHSSAEAESTYTYRLSAIHTNSSANSAKSESVSACYSLSLDTTSKSLYEGKSFTLTATYTGSKSLTWKTSNSSVATVSGGKVTAVKAGEATITVTDGTLSATCKVTVEASTGVLNVSVSDKTMYVGQTWQIPYSYNGNATLTWTARNTNIITVNSKGVVTAIATGKTYVTVTDGETTVRVIVTVEEKQPDVEDIVFDLEDSVFYNGVTRYVGDYCWLVAYTLPNEANKDVKITSSNTSVISISDADTSGITNGVGVKLTFKSAGTSTITFESADGSVKKSYKVNVKSDYDFNPGTGKLTPQKFAEYTTRVMCANGFIEDSTLGSWREFTMSANELTFENAKINAYAFIHNWWKNGNNYCYISYEGINEDGNYVFHAHWG